VLFSAPQAGLGGARVAALTGGGRIGVRPPLREDEAPVVRPYLGVSDIEAARRATERPGQGTFAIHILGGIEHGLWQL